MIKETIINFHNEDEDIDGFGTDISVLMKVTGGTVTEDIIKRMKDAIVAHKEENPCEWDTDSCIYVAIEVLENEGFAVEGINPTVEITF